MSTNSECALVEVAPGAWWYILEDYNAPKNAWDWREHAQCFGPFKTEDLALQHLRDNHVNPGGHSVQPYEPGYTPDETMKNLMALANRT